MRVWHVRLFEFVDGTPNQRYECAFGIQRHVPITFKRIFNIGIIYAHPQLVEH